MTDQRRPVAVGAATVVRRAGEPDHEPVELMAQAARRAAEDAGAPQLLRHLDVVMVPTGTWRYGDAARLVGLRVGSPDAHTVRAELGVLQTTLLRRAADLISRGEADVVLVAGGETRFRDIEAKASGVAPSLTDDAGAMPDETLRPHGLIVNHAEIDAGLISAVAQYALIEQARRIADGQSIAEHQRTVAELWAIGNQVAQRHRDAWNPAPMDATAIAAAGPSNRPLALPYLKWHNSQWNVDQAAAILLCSADAARRHGVPIDRWVFPRVIVDSDHAVALSERALLHRAPGFAVAARHAFAHCSLAVDELGPIDLYSCFPIAVRTQQLELGIDPTTPWTITGGMAFGGGPFNNYVLQSTANMIAMLRNAPERSGLVTAVSGLLTKQGVSLWSASAPERPYTGIDVGDEVAAQLRTVPVHDSPGTGHVASWTVTFDAEPKVFVLAERDDGSRAIVTTVDPAIVEIASRVDLAAAPVALHDDRTFTLGGLP